ncbi:hypothetical protein IWX47DRAFT_352076 [Phyllosticta citricarpa]
MNGRVTSPSSLALFYLSLSLCVCVWCVCLSLSLIIPIPSSFSLPTFGVSSCPCLRACLPACLVLPRPSSASSLPPSLLFPADIASSPLLHHFIPVSDERRMNVRLVRACVDGLMLRKMRGSSAERCKVRREDLGSVRQSGNREGAVNGRRYWLADWVAGWVDSGVEKGRGLGGDSGRSAGFCPRAGL